MTAPKVIGASNLEGPVIRVDQEGRVIMTPAVEAFFEAFDAFVDQSHLRCVYLTCVAPGCEVLKNLLAARKAVCEQILDPTEPEFPGYHAGFKAGHAAGYAECLKQWDAAREDAGTVGHGAG